MSGDDLTLKDWEMSKDRIKHFDDVVIRLRLQGIPIAAVIQAAGLTSFEYTHNIRFFGITATSFILLFGSIYLIPIIALDALHYKLLLLSVEHAQQIEKLPEFKGKIQITTKLTSPKLTRLHTICAALTYGSVLLLGIILAIMLNYN